MGSEARGIKRGKALVIATFVIATRLALRANARDRAATGTGDSQGAMRSGECPGGLSAARGTMRGGGRQLGEESEVK